MSRSHATDAGRRGGVRELRNVVERLVIMVPGPIVTALDLGFLGSTQEGPDLPPVQAQRPVRLQDARDRFERDYIVQALAEQRGNITRTAAALGMERSNLYRKMRSFGIQPPRHAGAADERVNGRADTPVSDPS